MQIIGKTVANANVFVKEQKLKSGSSGNFTTSVKLVEGENYISISAFDSSGTIYETILTVIYTP